METGEIGDRRPPRRGRVMSARWYVVAWRIPWVGLASVFRVLFVGAIFMAHGPTEARRVWGWTS